MTDINSFRAYYLRNYYTIWNDRLDALEKYITRMKRDEKANKCL